MKVRYLLRSLFTLGRGLIEGIESPDSNMDPIQLFGKWFSSAQKAGLFLPEAMTLATCSDGGFPSARMVLMKEFSQDGFVFFSNYESRKSHELAENPHAALVFHWGVLQRQVRVEGSVTRIPEHASKAYFTSRPRGRQIGAWASKQSRELPDTKILRDRVNELNKRFAGKEVPLPPFWGGYLVCPKRIEFWQGRPNRLHDRLVFERSEGCWVNHRLYP